MFTHKNIVINMHTRVICCFSFFVFTLNDLKQKMKVKEQMLNNKIRYTLGPRSTTHLVNCYMQHRVIVLFEIHKHLRYWLHKPLTAPTCILGFRSVPDTHSQTQVYVADRAIFPWQQCYSSFPLRLHAFMSFHFTVFPFVQVVIWKTVTYETMSTIKEIKYNTN